MDAPPYRRQMRQNGYRKTIIHKRSVHMQCKVIGIDLAKRTMQVCQLGTDQQMMSNKKVSRKDLLLYLSKLDPTVPIAMEACATAHFWGRRLKSLGRQVVLIPAQHVKPLVGHQKNDANDALAICEASQRPRIHYVPIKNVQCQDIQSLRRLRQRQVHNRTALGNQIRGLCSEYGLCFRESIKCLRVELQEALDDQSNELSTLLRGELRELYSELLECEARIKRLDRQLQSVVKTHPCNDLLRSIPGVGPMISAALISELGDGRRFTRGREFSASCGLIPRQHSSGGSERLLGITKNGDRELRTLLIHGARAVVYRFKNQDNALGRWLNALIIRRGVHKAIVALANKLARISWAVLRYQQPFEMSRAFS